MGARDHNDDESDDHDGGRRSGQGTGKEDTRRDQVRLGLEGVGVVALLLTLFFTGWQVKKATDAVEVSSEQLVEAKYESVYGHQLDLWRLAAEHPELAPHILNGQPVAEEADPSVQSEWGRRAAIITALDFYAYVFSQLAPADGDVYPAQTLNLNANPNDPPGYVDEAEWRGWVTWAETIRSGFSGNADLCDQLWDENKAYGGEEGGFFVAVTSSVEDYATDPKPSE
jgi:hypothetical protein